MLYKMRNLSLFVVFLAVFALLDIASPERTAAHPHCFIVNSVRFVFNSDGLERIRVDWQFDEFFSTQILAECDYKEGDGLSPQDKRKIKSQYFDTLSDYEFFSVVMVNGRRIETLMVNDLDITIIENHLLFQFSIPCPVSARRETQEVKAVLYDPSFYCSMNFPERLPVSVENEGDLDYTFRVRQNKTISYYYDQFHPWEAVLNFCLSPCEGELAGTGAAASTLDVKPETEMELVDETDEALPPEDLAPAARADIRDEEGPREAVSSEPGFSFVSWIMEEQRKLYERMAGMARRIKDGRPGAPLALLAGIAFLYGLIHAAGPGHGKAFAASFVLTRGISLKKALLLGNMIAVFHGVSAVLLVIALKTALTAFTGSALGRVEYVTKTVSFSIIMLLGLFLIAGALRKDGPGTKAESSNKGLARPWVLAAAIGLTPCPGVVLVLLFSMSLEIFWVGILMAVFQVAGMALTISLVTILAAGGRRSGWLLMKNNEKILWYFEHGMELLAGIAVFFPGIVLFVGNNRVTVNNAVQRRPHANGVIDACLIKISENGG